MHKICFLELLQDAVLEIQKGLIVMGALEGASAKLLLLLKMVNVRVIIGSDMKEHISTASSLLYKLCVFLHAATSSFYSLFFV